MGKVLNQSFCLELEHGLCSLHFLLKLPYLGPHLRRSSKKERGVCLKGSNGCLVMLSRCAFPLPALSFKVVLQIYNIFALFLQSNVILRLQMLLELAQ